MRSAVLVLNLGDAILESLVVRARLGELIVHLQGKLPISLLQVQLRHRLVDERLGRGTGEHPVFFP